LGLGIQSPWKLVNQRLDMNKQPHELHLEVKAERGSKYACPECGQLCGSSPDRVGGHHLVIPSG